MQFGIKTSAGSHNQRDEYALSTDLVNKRQGDEDPEDAKTRIRRANLIFVMALLLLAVVMAIDFISALYFQVAGLFLAPSHRPFMLHRPFMYLFGTVERAVPHRRFDVGSTLL